MLSGSTSSVGSLCAAFAFKLLGDSGKDEHNRLCAARVRSYWARIARVRAALQVGTARLTKAWYYQVAGRDFASSAWTCLDSLLPPHILADLDGLENTAQYLHGV